MFWLSFIFSFILYTSCILPLFISSFLSFLPLDSFVYLWQKGGEYTREYTKMDRHFYDSYAHSQGEKFHREGAYTKGEKTFLFKKTLFCLFYSLFVFLFFYMMLWVMFSIFALLFSYRIVFMCWTCIHPYAIILCWLHIQMIICFAMWSLWSFPYECLVFDQIAHMFHILFTWSLFNCYIILVILLLALPWGSNAFCANVSRYKYCVPSSS